MLHCKVSMKTPFLFTFLLAGSVLAAPAPHLTGLCGHVARGDIAATRASLNNGANPNSYDAYGKLPLTAAAANGHSEIAAMLIKAGARVNAVDTYGWTPLQVAALQGKTGCVNLLIEA